jgi:hypothetical protein
MVVNATNGKRDNSGARKPKVSSSRRSKGFFNRTAAAVQAAVHSRQVSKTTRKNERMDMIGRFLGDSGFYKQGVLRSPILFI